GRVSYDLQLSGSLLPGNYQLRLISGQQTDSQPVIIGSIGTSQYPTSIGSYPFTVQTDKAIYRTGDLIQVSGTGYPNTSVTGVMTSLSGNTYTVSTTVQSDGSYAMYYQTLQSYPTGTWRITMTNLQQSNVVYFLMQ